MGIFSFGKKDDAPARRGAKAGSARTATRGERVERRSRRAERPDADAMLLDPMLPEKQRARRRLVGAIAMVVAAVVILPMVLDSHPKPVTSDIAIDIPSRPVPKAGAADADTQAGIPPDSAAATGASGAVMAGAAPHGGPAASSGAANGLPVARTTPPAKRAGAAPTQAAANPPMHAPTGSGSPASPPGNRFAVELGSFPNDVSAKPWVTRLQALGVPAYIERRKQEDGSVRTLLRAGPFADRAAASAAIAKVREAGLMSGSHNGSGH
jgi:DedD protein